MCFLRRVKNAASAAMRTASAAPPIQSAGVGLFAGSAAGVVDSDVASMPADAVCSCVAVGSGVLVGSGATVAVACGWNGEDSARGGVAGEGAAAGGRRGRGPGAGRGGTGPGGGGGGGWGRGGGGRSGGGGLCQSPARRARF